MNNRELINRLEKYPDDYNIFISERGYDNIVIDVDHDYNCIYIDGYFDINSNTMLNIKEYNESLERADKVFKAIKFQRRLNHERDD